MHNCGVFGSLGGPEEGVQYILVGNKSDLTNRQVSKEKAEAWAKENQMRYIETSAKTGDGVNNMFLEIAGLIYNIQKEVREAENDALKDKGVDNTKVNLNSPQYQQTH